MLIKDYLLAIVVFGIMIMAATFLVADMSKEYNVVISQTFTQTYNTIDSMQNISNSTLNVISGNTIKPSDLAGATFEGIGGFFSMIFKSIFLPITLLNAAFTDLGIPSEASWIITAILIMITISIVFAVVSSILRRPV